MGGALLGATGGFRVAQRPGVVLRRQRLLLGAESAGKGGAEEDGGGAGKEGAPIRIHSADPAPALASCTS